MKKKSVFWFHTCSIWIMYFLMTYVCFFSIAETSNLTLADGVFLLVIGGIGMVIPTPGGIGSYHAIVMIGLSVLGIGAISFGDNGDTSNPALLFPTIIHAGQTLMAIIMGFIGLLILFLSKKVKSQGQSKYFFISFYRNYYENYDGYRKEWIDDRYIIPSNPFVGKGPKELSAIGGACIKQSMCCISQ